MLLADATSQEEVDAALAAGDRELHWDIEEKLSEAKREWEARDHCEWEDTADVLGQVVTSENPVFVKEIIEQSPKRPGYSLRDVPEEEVKQAIDDLSVRRNSIGIFEMRERRRRGADGFAYSYEVSSSCYFPEDYVFDGAQYIPEKIVRAFWKDLGYGIEWEQTHRISENWGWQNKTGEYISIVAGEEDWEEFCRDIVRAFVKKKLKDKPKEVVPLFLATVEATNKSLYEKLLARKLSKDILVRLAEWWYEEEENGGDPMEMLAGCIDDPHEGEEREVIATWSREEIAAMGIKSGTLYEDAPWTLVNLLPPSDTCMESVLMGHCVGDPNMGYNRAIEKGEMQAWSLRSRSGRPRFTLEVDSSFWEDPEPVPDATFFTPAYTKGAAIKQLKGKNNRLPGHVGSSTSEQRFPDEIVFWHHALRDLGADPAQVDDLPDLPTAGAGGGESLSANAGEACSGFDMPYRPLRRNRRSSKRRGSRRRTSRRRSSAR